jgi:hypothetical protein
MIDRMWKRLEAHQDFADVRGYGKEWRAMCSARSAAEVTAAEEAASYQVGEWGRFINGDKLAIGEWAKCRAEAWAAMDAVKWVSAVLRAQQTIKRAEQDAELAATRAIEWLDRAEGK